MRRNGRASEVEDEKGGEAEEGIEVGVRREPEIKAGDDIEVQPLDPKQILQHSLRYFLLMLLAMAIFWLFPRLETVTDPNGKMLVKLFTTSGIVVIVYAIARHLFLMPTGYFFIESKRPVGFYLKGAMMGVFLMSGLIGLNVLLGGLRYRGLGEIPPLFVILFLVGYVIQSFSEEYMTRGLITRMIYDRFGMRPAILAPSLLFTALHFANDGLQPFALLNLFLAGLIFALQTFLTGDLWMASGFHFAWNYMMGSIYGIPVSGIEQPSAVFAFEATDRTLINGGAFGIEGSLLTMVALSAYALLLCVLLHKSGATQRWRQTPDPHGLDKYKAAFATPKKPDATA